MFIPFFCICCSICCCAKNICVGFFTVLNAGICSAYHIDFHHINMLFKMGAGERRPPVAKLGIKWSFRILVWEGKLGVLALLAGNPKMISWWWCTKEKEREKTPSEGQGIWESSILPNGNLRHWWAPRHLGGPVHNGITDKNLSIVIKSKWFVVPVCPKFTASQLFGLSGWELFKPLLSDPHKKLWEAESEGFNGSKHGAKCPRKLL